MTESLRVTDKDDTQKTWRRRGLFAAAAALVAGVVARVSEQHVEAGVDGDVVLGAFNESAGETLIKYTGGPGMAFSARSVSPFTTGVEGVGTYVGVFGTQIGPTEAPLSAGVYGVASADVAAGVNGHHNGRGMAVVGTSNFGTGVFGAASSVGVYGLAFDSEGNSNGVAVCGANTGTRGHGIYGYALGGDGVVGAAFAPGAAAVMGTTNSIVGVYAGVFFGPVVVKGDFTVVGGAKSAAVPHSDGSHRRLYCVESPESWFEDFGKGTLTCGQAIVSLDPDFAAVVDLDDYHVFLTQYGGHDDLSVSEQTPLGFTVEAKDATSASHFSWRVVAKRKDIAAPRFEPVVVPPKPVMPTIPDPPAMPTSPVMRRHH